MSKKNFPTQIHRYLSGECSPEETKQVERWIEASPENRKTFEAIKKIWEVKPQQELRTDLAEAWSRLEEQISEKEAYGSSQRVHAFKPRFSQNPQPRRHVWLRVAA